MSDEPQTPRLYVFGDWARREAASPPTELQQRVYDWLEGKPVTLDEELSRALLEEFSAMERMRQRVFAAVQRCVGELKQRATEANDEANETPFRNAEQFAAGWRGGRHAAYSESAQALQDVVNAAVIGMAEDNEQ